MNQGVETWQVEKIKEGNRRLLTIKNIPINQLIGYQQNILKLNCPEQLVPCEVVVERELYSLYYDITHVVELEEYLGDQVIKKDVYVGLLESIIETLSVMGEYLLSDQQISFDRGHVYIDKKQGLPYLIYLPLKESDSVTNGFKEFINRFNHYSLEDGLISLSEKLAYAVTEDQQYGQLLYLIHEKDKWQGPKVEQILEDAIPENSLDKKNLKKMNNNFLLIEAAFVLVGVLLINFIRNSLDLYTLLGLGLFFVVGQILILMKFNQKGAKNKKQVDQDIYNLGTSLDPSLQLMDKCQETKAPLYQESGEFFIVFES